MKSIASGLIAIVLLVFYAHLVHYAAQVVSCVSQSGCTAYALTDFNSVKAQAMSVLGGLVSALIVAELAITKPGDSIGARVLAADASKKAKNVLKWVTGIYILVWLSTGAYAFLIGLEHPDVLPALSSVGQAWLGLSIASAYAYFGLSPR